VQKKLLFFYRSNFTRYDWDRFGLDQLVAAGFAVRIVQFNHLPGFEFLGKLSRDDSFQDICVYPRSFEELDRYLSAMQPGDVVFTTVGFKRDTAWLFRLFTKNNVNYIVQSFNYQNTFKGWRYSRGLRDLVRNKGIDARFLLSQFLHFISLCLSPSVRYLSLRPPAVSIRAGHDPFRFVPTFPHLHRAHAVAIESVDCRTADHPPPIAAELPARYAVFLDQNLPYHPDFVILGLRTVDPERYGAQINESLSGIESRTGLPVVIAPNPKWANARVDFGSRKIVAGATAELVRKSSLVVAHYSNSISFAVLFRKPVVFLTSHEMMMCGLDRHVACSSSWLGSKRLLMDRIAKELPPIDRLFTVNEIRYRAYDRTFLRTAGARAAPAGVVVAEQACLLSNSRRNGPFMRQSSMPSLQKDSL